MCDRISLLVPTLRSCEFFKFSNDKNGQIVGEALKLVHEYEHNEHGLSGGFGQASVSTGRTAADRMGADVLNSGGDGGQMTPMVKQIEKRHSPAFRRGASERGYAKPRMSIQIQNRAFGLENRLRG